MLLGELISKTESLKKEVIFYENILEECDVSVDGANTLINVLYGKIDNYNNYKNYLNTALSSYTIEINDKEVPLNEAVGFKNTLKRKIESLDLIIKRNSYGADLKIILDKREDLIKAFFHVDTLINALVWETKVEL